MTWPVWARTKSGLARVSGGRPCSAATLAVSTRWAPLVSTRTGEPSASKSRLLAIAPTAQPSASAASTAVWTVSGSTTMRPVPPAAAQAARKVAMPGWPGRLGAVRGRGCWSWFLTGSRRCVDELSGEGCTFEVFEHLFERSGGSDLDPHSHRTPSHGGGTVPGAGAGAVGARSGRGRWQGSVEGSMTVETVEVARMRRYDDPVEVRRGMVSGEQGPVEGPEQFLWHGRLWKVYDVVGHWSGDRGLVAVARGGAGARRRRRPGRGRAGRGGGASVHDLLGEREVWRVEAGRGAGRRPRRLRPRLRLGPGQLGPHPVLGLIAMTRSDRPAVDPADLGPRSRPVGVRRARRDLRLPHPGGVLAAGGDHHAPTSGCATPPPTSRRCGPPPRCSPPAPVPPPGRHAGAAGPGPSATPGCCSPRWLRSSPSGRGSSPPEPPSGPRPRPGRGGRSPSGRPTTSSVTPTASSASSRSPSGSPATCRCPATLVQVG